MPNTKQNLSSRGFADTEITLDFDIINGELKVSVTVKSFTDDFTLYPPNELAMDCFNHPYAYLDRVLATYAEIEKVLVH